MKLTFIILNSMAIGFEIAFFLLRYPSSINFLTFLVFALNIVAVFINSSNLISEISGRNPK